MSVKITKVHDMTMEDLDKKLGVEGRASIHWKHMMKEVKNRSINTCTNTKEGKASRVAAEKVLEKFKI